MKWISVKDKLPNELSIILVYGKVYDDDFEIGWAFYNTKDQYCGTNYYYKDVTHWMDLPKPPKDQK